MTIRTDVYVRTKTWKFKRWKGFIKKRSCYIGVVESVYSEWENGKLSIPTKRIYELSNYFEVNIDYMLGISDNRVHLKTNNEINIDLVSTRLKEIRKSLKLTMRDLANKFNTSSSAISNYSIDWVLGRSEDKFLK